MGAKTSKRRLNSTDYAAFIQGLEHRYQSNRPKTFKIFFPEVIGIPDFVSAP
jgi:hypothetical protein